MRQKLTTGNYIGYGLCDLSGMLAFSALGSYLSVYCTDILKISTTAVFMILLCARIWDGINDPIMGTIAQNRKAGKLGKYRPFLLIGGIPMALISVLCLTAPAGLSGGWKVAYAAVCYIAYGMLYTVVLVPYGSMASVMTRDEQERSRLSMCRSIGGGIGSLPATLVFPLTVFTAGVLDGKKLSLTMLVLALFMIVFYLLSFLLVRENYTVGRQEERLSFRKALPLLLKNRAFVIMSLVGCLHMAVSMFMNSVNVYLFKDYFRKPGLLTILTIVSYIPMLLMIPFAGKIIRRFGKRSVCLIGFALSALVSLLAFLCRFTSPWPFLACSFLINAGIGFMTLEVWAMAADVIDAVFVETGRSMEAVSYSCFTFMRKIGQAIAASVTLFLGAFGYDSALVDVGQSARTLSGIYTTATLVPCILFVLLFVLMLLYPMNKQRMEEMHEKLAEVRQ